MLQFGYTAEQNRIASLENEVDRLAGRPPRNRYTCTVCYGDRVINEANARLGHN